MEHRLLRASNGVGVVGGETRMGGETLSKKAGVSLKF